MGPYGTKGIIDYCNSGKTIESASEELRYSGYLTLHIGEHVFINTGCTMQDQGGIYIGNEVLLGHREKILMFSRLFLFLKRIS